MNIPLALLYCCRGFPLPLFLSTLTCFIVGHDWCVPMDLCVCLFMFVWYTCVHLQSSNPVFTVTPQQLMSSVEALLVSEAFVHVHVYYCVCV